MELGWSWGEFHPPNSLFQMHPNKMGKGNQQNAGVNGDHGPMGRANDAVSGISDFHNCLRPGMQSNALALMREGVELMHDLALSFSCNSIHGV